MDEDDIDSSTMVRYNSTDMTLQPDALVRGRNTRNHADLDGSLKMLSADDGSTMQPDLGTMVINSDTDEEDEDSTMKRHDTAPGESRKYRPLFLDHFDKIEQEKKARSEASRTGGSGGNSPLSPVAPSTGAYTDTARPSIAPITAASALQQVGTRIPPAVAVSAASASDSRVAAAPAAAASHPLNQAQLQHHQQYGTTVYTSPNCTSPQSTQQCNVLTPDQQKQFENQLARELDQLQTPSAAGGAGVAGGGREVFPPSSPPPPAPPLRHHQQQQENNKHNNKFQRSFIDGDFDFLRGLSRADLEVRMSSLDQEMELEIDELRQRYQAKRQPILDAMDHKRKRQQNF
uniref:Serine/threonine-protein kinase 3-like n=1 Tax=Hirondellea gigas TaxID=1518452 RepID=A0A6A7FYW0_9CRUS